MYNKRIYIIFAFSFFYLFFLSPKAEAAIRQIYPPNLSDNTTIRLRWSTGGGSCDSVGCSHGHSLVNGNVLVTESDGVQTFNHTEGVYWRGDAADACCSYDGTSGGQWSSLSDDTLNCAGCDDYGFYWPNWVEQRIKVPSDISKLTRARFYQVDYWVWNNADDYWHHWTLELRDNNGNVIYQRADVNGPTDFSNLNWSVTPNQYYWIRLYKIRSDSYDDRNVGLRIPLLSSCGPCGCNYLVRWGSGEEWHPQQCPDEQHNDYNPYPDGAVNAEKANNNGNRIQAISPANMSRLAIWGEATPIPTPTPTPVTCTVQGYKNPQTDPGVASAAILRDGGNPQTSNPYYQQNIPIGNHTISASSVSGYDNIAFSCSNQTICNTTTNGGCYRDQSSVPINCPSSGGTADLWWQYSKNKTCSVSLSSNSVNIPNSVTVTFSGNAYQPSEQARLWVEKSDGTQITGSINPSPIGSGVYNGTYYYELAVCQSNNSAACNTSVNVTLPVGTYKFHCDMPEQTNCSDVCSGNPFCTYEGGSQACSGWKSCSSNDNANLSVTIPYFDVGGKVTRQQDGASITGINIITGTGANCSTSSTSTTNSSGYSRNLPYGTQYCFTAPAIANYLPSVPASYLNQIAGGAPSCGTSCDFSYKACASTSPVTTSPVNNTTTTPCNGAVTLTWNSVQWAETYALRVDDMTDPWNGTCTSSNGDFCDNNVTATSYTFNPKPGHKYQWWVHAVTNGCGWTSPSPFSYFTQDSCSPTLSSLVINNAGAPVITGLYKYSGSSVVQNGSDWLNPINVILTANPVTGTLTDYYVAFYSGAAASQATFLGDIQGRIQTDPKSAILLHYTASGTYQVWDYFLNGGSGGWGNIVTLYNVCGKDMSGNKDCTNKKYYNIKPGPTGAYWIINFDKNFGSKNFYTAGYVVNSAGKVGFSSDILPVTPTP